MKPRPQQSDTQTLTEWEVEHQHLEALSSVTLAMADNSFPSRGVEGRERSNPPITKGKHILRVEQEETDGGALESKVCLLTTIEEVRA